jgi:hypothetical protein
MEKSLLFDKDSVFMERDEVIERIEGIIGKRYQVGSGDKCYEK